MKGDAFRKAVALLGGTHEVAKILGLESDRPILRAIVGDTPMYATWDGLIREALNQSILKTQEVLRECDSDTVNVRVSCYMMREHVQAQLASLGVTYKLAVPQPIGDCWFFFGCKNIPNPMPKNFRILTSPLESYIGHGLSARDVAMLRETEQ